jgi:DNA polymerase-4
MPTRQALELCPSLVLVRPDHALYRRMHDRLRAVTDRLFPRAVWCSIDEFFADTTDLQSLHPDPLRMAATVKQAILDETGLPCTVGIASGRIVAKVAADQHKPDGIAIIQPGSEAEFLAPLPIRALPGIGPKTAARLTEAGLHRVGELLDPRWSRTLTHVWGRRLLTIQAMARGLDPEPISWDGGQKSIGHETTFDQDTDDRALLEEIVHDFLTTLTHDLRAEQLAAGCVTVKLKDAGFRITTRQCRLPDASNYDPAMWPTIRRCLAELVVPGVRYRLVGLSLSDLVPASESLFDRRLTQAMAAMDRIIDRHGAHVIRIGARPKAEG